MMKKTAFILVVLIIFGGCSRRTVVQRNTTIVKYVREAVVEKAPQREKEEEKPVQMNFSVNYPKQSAEGYLESGKVAYGNCDFQEAMRDFSMVLNSSAPAEIRAEAYAYMGACCFYVGRTREARAFCEKARETYPDIRLSREEFPREVIDFCN